MTYLPSLIKRIDKFCLLSEDFRTIKRFGAPNPWDDPNFGMKSDQDEESQEENIMTDIPHFEELVNIARQVDDPGLSKQLEALAELYKYSLQIGGGYATIAKAINNLKNMYSDDTESDIESILNGMLQTLAKVAGSNKVLAGPDNPKFVERLLQLKSDIDARSSNSDTLDTYQDDVNVSGARGESEDDLNEYGLGDDSKPVAPAALGFGNKEDPKANRGWNTTGPKVPYKDWEKHFETEIASYGVELEQTHNPDVAAALNSLIQLTPQLSAKVIEAIKLKDLLKVAPNQQGKIQLDELKQDIKGLRVQKTILKKKIRSDQLLNEKNKLDAELAGTTNWKEQEVIKQKLALNALTQSKDYRKAKERNLRLHLIENMSGGNFPSAELLANEKAKIDVAQQARISKEKYDREQMEQIGLQQGRPVVPTAEPLRGGPRERLSEEENNNIKKNFKALVYQFQIDIASAVQAARQAIYETGKKDDKGKKILYIQYKSVIDKISAAIQNKNRQELYLAQKELKDNIYDNIMKRADQLKGYVDIIKLAPHFTKVLESIKELTKNKKDAPPKLDEVGNLFKANFSENDLNVMKYILNDMNRLKMIYKKYNISGIKRFKNVTEDMEHIENQFKLIFELQGPDKKKLYPDKSPVAKEIAKKQLEEELKRKVPKTTSVIHRLNLLKMAQEAQLKTPGPEIDQTTADKMATDIFNQIFDEAYQKMINGLKF
jgi:hypothetical protein